MKKFIKRLFLVVLCIAIAYVALRIGPNLYYRIFGSNTQWVSERFSEELKEKNEWVVFETILTGQETVTQSAWLLGKVQEVTVPYSYAIRFVVDLSQSNVKATGNTIQVSLPAPLPAYSRLDVDDDSMKKIDWLYPLTPERYAEIKKSIEDKLYAETSLNQTYLDAAWETTVRNVKSLFRAVAEQANSNTGIEISVVQAAGIPVSQTEIEVPATLPKTP